ncbi:MAG: hypothetical protein ACOC1Z_03640 [Cyanobacteriota bacterium]
MAKTQDRNSESNGTVSVATREQDAPTLSLMVFIWNDYKTNPFVNSLLLKKSKGNHENPF